VSLSSLVQCPRIESSAGDGDCIVRQAEETREALRIEIKDNSHILPKRPMRESQIGSLHGHCMVLGFASRVQSSSDDMRLK
jgi:hypothetical protein